MPNTVTVNQAIDLQSRGAILVDVREADEFKAIAAPGAINVPLSMIQKNGHMAYRQMGVDPTLDGLLVICRSGGRSAMACDHLGNNAINVEGGMLAWQLAGLAICE